MYKRKSPLVKGENVGAADEGDLRRSLIEHFRDFTTNAFKIFQYIQISKANDV